MKYIAHKGFTLLELLISITLVLIISGIVYSSFSALNNRQILDQEIARIKSYIEKSRMNSLNSKNGNEHGIRFASSSITTVEVTATSTQNVFTQNNTIKLVGSTLGTTTLTFARISGLPNATGVLTYTYSSGTTVIATSTITINGAGIVQ